MTQPHGNAEPGLSFTNLDTKLADIKTNPAEVSKIKLEDAMFDMSQNLKHNLDAQKDKIVEFKELWEEIQKSIRRVQGVDTTSPDLETLTRNLNRFKDHMNKVHERWVQLNKGAVSTVTEEHKDDHGHGPARPDRAREALGKHKWKEQTDPSAEKPIIDIPSLELEKIIPTQVFMEAYTALAKGDEQGAQLKIKELFDSADNLALQKILQEQKYNLVDFDKLWTKELWKDMYKALKQTVAEDITQEVESKIGLLDKAIISGPRILQQAAVSGAVVGVGAAGGAAIATALGAGTIITTVAAGAAGGVARRTQVGWWERMRDWYKDLGEEGETVRHESTKNKKKEKIISELEIGATAKAENKRTDKVREMASWISQSLRDVTAKKAVEKESKVAQEEKTGLVERDDANIYELRMRAAKELRTELAANGDIAEKRTATLDQLTNGLNAGRDSAGSAYVANENSYNKKFGPDKPIKAKAKAGELNAEVGEKQKTDKRNGTIATVLGGATIGVGMSLGLPSLAGGSIAAVTGGGLGMDDRARHKSEAIKSGFEKNLDKTVAEAEKIITFIKKKRAADYNAEPDFELRQKNAQLEAIIKSGAFHKNKPMETAARDALHEGRRNYKLRHLEAELNGTTLKTETKNKKGKDSKKVVEQEVKRLTKKRINWGGMGRVIKGAAIGVALSYGTQFIANTAHRIIDKKSPEPPTPTPEKIVKAESQPETKLYDDSLKSVEAEAKPIDNEQAIKILREKYYNASIEIIKKWQTRLEEKKQSGSINQFQADSGLEILKGMTVVAEVNRVDKGSLDNDARLFIGDTPENHNSAVDKLETGMLKNLSPEAQGFFTETN